MAIEELGQRFRHVLDQVEAIRHLGRRRRPVPGAVSIGFGPIPRDHLHARVGLEPLCERVALAVRKQGDGLAAFQVHEDGAIRVAFPQRPIIHAQDAGRGKVRLRLPAQPAQQQVPADPQAPRVAEAYPRCPAQRHAERHQALGQPQRTARPGGRHGRQAFREDAAAAAAIAAKPLADTQVKADAIRCPGQVRQGALVVTMDAPGRGGAQRTRRAALGRLHGEVICAAASSTSHASRRSVVASGNKRAKDVGGMSGDESGVLLKAIMSPSSVQEHIQ